MAQYRKKPVVIEAIQFDGTTTSWNKIRQWANTGPPTPQAQVFLNTHGIEVKTLEGRLLAKKGDWIIKGVKGEFYPCKPDIFKQTYEAVKD